MQMCHCEETAKLIRTALESKISEGQLQFSREKKSSQAVMSGIYFLTRYLEVIGIKWLLKSMQITQAVTQQLLYPSFSVKTPPIHL